MRLSRALRLQPGESISFSGSGGKTSALIALARELNNPVIATTTTHFSQDQLGFADQIVRSREIVDAQKFVNDINSGITLLIGEQEGNQRVSGPPPSQLQNIYGYTRRNEINLLIEADGSRQRPLKAPDTHEPVIPPFIDQAVVVAGLSALGKSFSSKIVHRVEQFARLSQLEEGELITKEAVLRVLLDKSGGLKGIPENARRICLLNQANNENLQASGKRMADSLNVSYDSTIISSIELEQEDKNEDGSWNYESVQCEIFGVHETVAGITLAAGGSKRMGRPKQLLPWAGTSLIRHTVSQVLKCGIDRVIVVVGAYENRVREELTGLPVEVVSNTKWEQGQSTSVQVGLSTVPKNSGAAIFFLVDQPNISQSLIRTMIDRHANSLAPIIAPLVTGQRGNPVMFDRSTFDKFGSLQGDVGGKQLFSRYQVDWVEWFDESVLEDIDTNDDYQRLISGSR
jgi:molybdenum cofactor cytidylyltransferase